MKILHIDMDGVIADFEGGVKSFEPDMCWDRENVDRVCEANCRVFTLLPPIKEGVEAVKYLADSNEFDIYFLSTPMWNVPESYGDKRIWLVEHFGEWAQKRLILTHRKDLVVGDYLIDDRTMNGAGEFKGEFIHFGSEKFPDWESVVNYLLI